MHFWVSIVTSLSFLTFFIWFFLFSELMRLNCAAGSLQQLDDLGTTLSSSECPTHFWLFFLLLHYSHFQTWGALPATLAAPHMVLHSDLEWWSLPSEPCLLHWAPVPVDLQEALAQSWVHTLTTNFYLSLIFYEMEVVNSFLLLYYKLKVWSNEIVRTLWILLNEIWSILFVVVIFFIWRVKWDEENSLPTLQESVFPLSNQE